MKDIPSAQKLRGGYYTPEPIARFLIDWALEGNQGRLSILEPSMGDGAFITSLVDKMTVIGCDNNSIYSSITGVELFEEEIDKCRKKLDSKGYEGDKFHFINNDFFSMLDKNTTQLEYDVILGNPPFIRYQNFPTEQRDKAMKQLLSFGFKQSKLTNAWLLFLLRSITLMKPKSRLAMVIPAELLQVSYAAATRKFISEHFSRVTVMTFRSLVFEGIQQEVVLLMAEKDPGMENHGIDVIEIEDISELSRYKHVIKDPEHLKPIDHLSDKWIQYFLDKSDILLLKSLETEKRLSRLGELASVDVGIVTGNNKFFVLDKSTMDRYDLKDYTLPLVGRSMHLSGIKFTSEDWREVVSKGAPSYLLAIKNTDKISSKLMDYLAQGRENGVDKGYKCRIRKNWYVVPSVSVSDAFMLRQIHAYPKVILNEAKAVCTDTIHRVKALNNTDTRDLSYTFINSLSFAISEVVGRSYGGGVLELEPSEAESILVPYDKTIAKRIDKSYMDECLKSGRILDALDHSDKILLIDYLGFSEKQVKAFRSIWQKLSNRRLKRR